MSPNDVKMTSGRAAIACAILGVAFYLL